MGRGRRRLRARCLLIAVLLPPVLAGGVASGESPSGTPSYVIESIEIHGNTKTKEYVIRQAVTVRPGQRLSVDDPRFEAQRYQVLALGFFSDVQLRLRRGTKRGRVVLVVDVTERGTLLLTDLFLGFSEATAAWGGFGVAERNFLGRGVSVEAAFVLGADPDVERGALQQSYWLRLSLPHLAGGPLEVSSSFIFLDGSDFFRKSGPDDSAAPSDFLSVRYRRVGGTAGLGLNLARNVRMHIDYRGEAVRSDIPLGAVRTLPTGEREPIDFGIPQGDSVLSNVSVAVEYDTRSDPIVPERGMLLTFNADTSTHLLGSSFSYVKLTSRFRYFWPLPWRHVLAAGAFAGVIFGEAPFFERFFVGDFNALVPSRSLGLNFSTLPSRDVFGTSIDSKRYEEIALRTSVEYLIPWFRGGKFAYSGDFFVNLGLIFLSSKGELNTRDRPLGEAIPIDLTVDAGLRLDTRIGVFRFSIGNGLGRLPF